MKTLALLGIIFALPSIAGAAIVPGAIPKKWKANPAKHTVVIKRGADDKKLAAMIAAAEAAPPAAEELRKAIAEGDPAPEDKQWWHRQALGIRIPFSLTGDAVAYYEKMIRGFGKQDFERFVEPSSSLDYQATAAFHAKHEHQGRQWENVYVVTLKLRFNQSFSATPSEGIEFDTERTVILDASGKVLSVSGDGATEAAIFAI